MILFLTTDHLRFGLHIRQSGGGNGQLQLLGVSKMNLLLYLFFCFRTIRTKGKIKICRKNKKKFSNLVMMERWSRLGIMFKFTDDNRMVNGNLDTNCTRLKWLSLLNIASMFRFYLIKYEQNFVRFIINIKMLLYNHIS